jgi:hypothetical protein
MQCGVVTLPFEIWMEQILRAISCDNPIAARMSIKPPIEMKNTYPPMWIRVVEQSQYAVWVLHG